MNFINLKHPDEVVDFETAVRRGLGRNRGLYFPETIPRFNDVDRVLNMPFIERSALILSRLTGLDEVFLEEIVRAAFNFPLEQVAVSENISALELFHGPSLAFKDFGARFMAGCLSAFSDGKPTTILTATSGDTGAAVAHAFFNKPGVRAVILYPKGRITGLQEKLFCTLGGNIHTIAVDADFDACQALVKRAFDDESLRQQVGLNSANSINVARLLAQVCYYFESAARLEGAAPTFCVPSGNFGNVTACLVARGMGMPIHRVIAATNINDTVPRYLEDGQWAPRKTIATISNAMDISRPNNFPRVEELAKRAGQPIDRYIESCSTTDFETSQAIRDLNESGYLADPHTALAWRALKENLAPEEAGVFLCTAHPAKFAEVIEDALGQEVPLPDELLAVRDKPLLSVTIGDDDDALKAELLSP